MTSDKNSVITRQDLNKMAINQGSLGMEFSWNYLGQMHLAFGLMMNPILKKIYKDDKKGYSEALARNCEFFNITPQFAPFVGGIVASMEEKHAKGEIDASSISSTKTALMGPLSGIGDSIFLGCIRIIALGVGISLAMQQNILGPILYFLIYNIPAFATRFYGVHKGYDLGVKYLNQMQSSKMMDKLMYAAGILGIMVIGTMSKDMVWTGISLQIGSGDTAVTLQSVFDQIMPGLVGISVTWFYYWLLKKKINPVLIILGTIIVGILGVYTGVLG